MERKNVMTTPKNMMGKCRDTSNPYAVFSGIGPFGETEVRILKAYQKPHLELENKYARWFVAVKSDDNFGEYDEGDGYVNEVVRGLVLTETSKAFKDNYDQYMEALQKRAGYIVEGKTIIPKTSI